ncbi:hypothetical protein EUTSA_v10020884mg [Eutrema salsugineum]|uniref:Potassium channel domain-containing protein n=1 Tax=Eutrema salsugineum TaxID=72664 RepID=V4NNR8_EUTSA|nr:hypothetical protein EUTSA_v10020884mg [Eutrema salsugineum]
MTSLRKRWYSDPEHLSLGGASKDNSGDTGHGGGRGGRGGRGRGGGRATGGALGGGRRGRAAGGASGSGTVAPGANLPDSYSLDMDTIEENSVGGRKKKNKKKNGAKDNTEKFKWMNSRILLWVSYLLGIWAVYSSVMAPLKCAFKVNDFPQWIPIAFEIFIGLDILRDWIYVYANDNQAMAMLHYLVWIKTLRALKGKQLLEKLEKRQGLNFSFISFLKLMFIQLYWVHITGCLLYHIATTSHGHPESHQTWMSLIQIGDQNLSQLGIVPKYIAAVYFATVTTSTVGYGDIHAVNEKEMLVVAGVIIFSMIVWLYLGVKYTNLFLRRSKAEIVGEKLDIMEKYLTKTNVNQDLAKVIRDHMVIKYNEDYDNRFLEDVPASLRAKLEKQKPFDHD